MPLATSSRRTRIARNDGLGIDLANDGVTLNDVGDVDTGPNALLNFPVLESALLQGTDLIVTGWARPGTTIELFNGAADATGFGQGETFVARRVEGSADDEDATATTYGPAPVNGRDAGHRHHQPVSVRHSRWLRVVVGAQLTATSSDGRR